jgi:hypothetical protein
MTRESPGQINTLLHDVLSEETCSVPVSSAYSLYLLNFKTLQSEVFKININTKN